MCRSNSLIEPCEDCSLSAHFRLRGAVPTVLADCLLFLESHNLFSLEPDLNFVIDGLWACSNRVLATVLRSVLCCSHAPSSICTRPSTAFKQCSRIRRLRSAAQLTLLQHPQLNLKLLRLPKWISSFALPCSGYVPGVAGRICGPLSIAAGPLQWTTIAGLLQWTVLSSMAFCFECDHSTLP